MSFKFDNVVSVTRVADTGGDRIQIVFTNGAQIWVCPENDGVHYFAPGVQESPSVQVLVDLGAGHMPGEKPHLTLRTDCELHVTRD